MCYCWFLPLWLLVFLTYLVVPILGVCVCVCVYIYTHTHTHTHIQLLYILWLIPWSLCSVLLCHLGFVLKSILSDMSIATLAFFWFSFAWNTFFYPLTFGEWHGNPLQYSCLENPMNRDWQAVVHRVAQSQTQLKRFSMT